MQEKLHRWWPQREVAKDPEVVYSSPNSASILEKVTDFPCVSGLQLVNNKQFLTWLLTGVRGFAQTMDVSHCPNGRSQHEETPSVTAGKKSTSLPSLLNAIYIHLSQDSGTTLSQGFSRPCCYRVRLEPGLLTWPLWKDHL